MRDPYSVLGVSKTASDADIKSAYRKLAKKHHPDQNANDPKAKDRFAELNAAYEIVGDKDARAKFDRGEIGADGKPKFSGFEGFRRGSPFGDAPRGSSGRRTGAGSFDDILNDLFGGGGMGGGPTGGTSYSGTGGAGTRTRGYTSSGTNSNPGNRGPGQDVTVTAEVTLADVVARSKMRVSLPTGKTLDVTIPLGVVDGQQVRLKGQGYPGIPAGDAWVTVSFVQHPIFKADGTNVRLELPVTLYEAVLGAKVRVPTMEGSVEMSIPQGYTGGRVFRMRGKGLPKTDGERGDLLVAPRIHLPEGQPSEDLIDLVEDMRLRQPYNPRGPEFG